LHRVKKLICLVLAWAGASLGVAQAAVVELYRFENEDGVVVLARSIPPELVYKGYTVVSEDGTVLRVVPRQLTPQEIVERDRGVAARKAVEAGELDRAHKDEELARLYASTVDLVQARDRKVQSIEGAIAATQGNIERLKLQKRHLEEQAAERERAGKLPSPEILDNLTILSTQIADKEHELAMRRLEQQQIRQQFQEDIERFEVLFGSPPAASTPAGALIR
jgi:hypothetical protein